MNKQQKGEKGNALMIEKGRKTVTMVIFMAIIFTSPADETSSFGVCHWLLIPTTCFVPAVALRWPSLAENDYLLGFFGFEFFPL